MIKRLLGWIGLGSTNDPEKPAARWAKEKLSGVKSYLENKDPHSWSREDNYLAAEFVIQRYLPEDSGRSQADYDLAMDNIKRKIDRNIDFPNAPKEEVKDDPEFAAWLEEHLK